MMGERRRSEVTDWKQVRGPKGIQFSPAPTHVKSNTSSILVYMIIISVSYIQLTFQSRLGGHMIQLVGSSAKVNYHGIRRGK